MVEKELGVRNFCFDSLRYMNCDMLAAAGLPEAPPPGSGQRAAGSARFSLLQIDVEVEEPETSENPTKSFVIHNIVWRRTQLIAVYMNHDMEEKGIVGRECLPLEPPLPLPRDHRLGAAGGGGA
ncbi:unnamed protein product [Boreogadus saida]